MNAIDRFGVLGVMGRTTLSHGEIKRMTIAENILRAHRDMKTIPAAKYAEDNPEMLKLMQYASELVKNV